MLLMVWSLINVFLHNDASLLQGNNFVNYHFNISLMFEGFIYVFCGCLFVITVVRHATNIRFIWLLIPFAFIPWIRDMQYMGSMTPMLSLGLATTIYLFLKKRFIWGILCVSGGISIILLNLKWVLMKFGCRPFVWGQLLRDMFYHPTKALGTTVIDQGVQFAPFLERFVAVHNLPRPWFASLIGRGFSRYLMGEYTWVDKDVYGWVYNQNDLLHLGMCLGPLALIFALWFIIKTMKGIGLRLELIPFLAIMIACSFQLTMFTPEKAGICLIIGTLCMSKKEAI